MKHIATFPFALALSCALLCSACGGSGKTTLLLLPGEDGGPTVMERGDLVAFTAGQKTFVMVYANDGTEITFPTGLDDTGTATLSGDFYMGQAEVTSGLFVAVYQWAYDNGRFSDTVTDHNGVDDTTAKYGGQQLINLGSTTVAYSGGVFSVEGDSENKPVANVTWYGAVMFCNWLTEMTDGDAGNVVYSGIDTTWDHTETAASAAKSGYRLPSSEEWQFAARYIGTTAPSAGDLATEFVAQSLSSGSVLLTAGYYWTPGDYASGATRDYTNVTETRAVSWYTTGTPGEVAKDVGLKAFNGLNLYDMSGNVWEWCFTQSQSLPGERVMVGGGINEKASGMTIGDVTSDTPDDNFYSIGFRIAKNR